MHTNTWESAKTFAKALNIRREVDETCADAGQSVVSYGSCVAIGGRCNFGVDTHDRRGPDERGTVKSNESAFVLTTLVHTKLSVHFTSAKAGVAPTSRDKDVRPAVRTRHAMA